MFKSARLKTGTRPSDRAVLIVQPLALIVGLVTSLDVMCYFFIIYLECCELLLCSSLSFFFFFFALSLPLFLSRHDWVQLRQITLMRAGVLKYWERRHYGRATGAHVVELRCRLSLLSCPRHLVFFCCWSSKC